MNRIRKIASVVLLAGVATASVATSAKAYTLPGFAGLTDPGCMMEVWNNGEQVCSGFHQIHYALVDNDTNNRSPEVWVNASGLTSNVNCFTQAVPAAGMGTGSYTRAAAVSPGYANTPVALVPARNVPMPPGQSLEMICNVNDGSSIISLSW